MSNVIKLPLEECTIKRVEIPIPAGIKYIGEDWKTDEDKKYDLKKYPFPHILNKVLTGCGFTEYCINNDQHLILCSPRRMLLENKKEQHPELNVYYAKNDIDENIVNYERGFTVSESRKAITKAEAGKSDAADRETKAARIIEYKEKVKTHYLKCLGHKLPCKILVTYDSFRHVKEALIDLLGEEIFNDTFQIVVDEFQSILVDVKFKPSTELELLEQLKGFLKVCYVSATPMMDKYLMTLDEFKHLPYYEFDWVKEDPNRIIKPNLVVRSSDSIFKDLVKVIYSYKEERFERECIKDEHGEIKEIISNEAVLYVNSVRLICSMITKCELLPEQCNILCARTPDNEEKVRKAFNDVYKALKRKTRIKKGVKIIGSVPGKGEKHKMFTFCTRTVYLGADFYSTCARSFIFCDSNIDCLSVDISLDLPQILGRQRLEENPWKICANIYVKSTIMKLKRSDFENKINNKVNSTNNLLTIYFERVVDKNEKTSLVEKFESDCVANSYKKDYIAVNRHAGSSLVPVFNKLMLVSEMRAFDIQQMDYADRVSIFNTLTGGGFLTTDVDEEIDKFNSIAYYHHKMKYVCEVAEKLPKEKFILFLNSIPKSFKGYYLVLGSERCKSLGYKKSELEKEHQRQLNNQGITLDDRVYDAFHVGDRYTKAVIKEKLAKIYEEAGYDGKAKAVDIKSWFDIKEVQFRIKGTTKKEAGFELIGIVKK